MPKKDIYASVGTTLICGLILLLLLLLKLVVPTIMVEEQGIEVGYGIDLEGEVGGSSGGQHGDLAGSTDGDLYKKKIDIPSFSQKPQIVDTKTTTSNTPQPVDSQDDFFTQTTEESYQVDTIPTNTNNSNQKTNDIAKQRRQERLAQRNELSKRANNLGVSAFGKSGSTGNGKYNMGGGTGNGNGTGQGDGVGNGVGSGRKGNPLGRGTSNGSSWSLEGRNLKGTIAKPSYRQNVAGKITVKIRVDDNGRVVSASIGQPTTIADQSLRQSTLESARKTIFSSGKGTVYGNIVYLFKLN